MANYYDLILGFIPLALLGLGGGLHIAGLTLTTAVTIGGLVAVGLVGHALFVRAPVDAPVSVQEAPTVESSGAAAPLSD